MKWLHRISQDVLIAALALGIFIHHQFFSYGNALAPQVYASEAVTPQDDLAAPEEASLANPLSLSGLTYQELHPQDTVTLLGQYANADGTLFTSTYKIETNVSAGKVTFYAADVLLSDITQFQTAYAKGAYGQEVEEKPLTILQENNGILGLSGDNWGLSDGGIIVRNGTWYREKPDGHDLCVLYRDGRMETLFSDAVDINTLKNSDVWQTFSFGPALLDNDGNPLSSFHAPEYIRQRHPRAVVGYIAPGHYVWIAIDGREDGYSVGVTLPEEAQLCSDLGCKSAYNLDGGKTATLMNQNSFFNKPCEGMAEKGGREMCDILFLRDTDTTAAAK